MVTEHHFIFAWLDGYLSEDYSHSSNEDALDQMVDDYSAVLDYIQLNMTFVNLGQTCLLGSNIGGSLVLLALSSPSSFRCGIAISPIVEWHSISKFTDRLDKFYAIFTS